jgi:hypothetical protein
MAQANPSIFIQLIILLPIPLLVVWAWMFREMINNDRLPSDTKNYWTLLFIFLNVLAAMLYYVNVYKDS